MIFGSDGTDYSLKIDLSQISELSIGDKSGANIELSTEYGKDTFVSIVQANNKIELIEKASKYGTYVNGKRISKKAVLKDFDFISWLISQHIIKISNLILVKEISA